MITLSVIIVIIFGIASGTIERYIFNNHSTLSNSTYHLLRHVVTACCFALGIISPIIGLSAYLKITIPLILIYGGAFELGMSWFGYRGKFEYDLFNRTWMLRGWWFYVVGIIGWFTIIIIV